MHATLADVIADTVHNSIEAEASRIVVELKENGAMICVKIQDNGKGMDKATQSRVWDPFYSEPGKHASRRVGLGLPILKQIADATGGHVELQSGKGVGTTLSYSFTTKHIDLPPMGDLAGMMTTLFNYGGSFELVWSHEKERKSYTVSRSQLTNSVGNLDSADAISLVKKYLCSQENDLIVTD